MILKTCLKEEKLLSCGMGDPLFGWHLSLLKGELAAMLRGTVMFWAEERKFGNPQILVTFMNSGKFLTEENCLTKL